MLLCYQGSARALSKRQRWRCGQTMTHDEKYRTKRAPGAVAGARDAEVVRTVGQRSLVLVGMMGAGKSSVGRRLALRLSIPFRDADEEIELAHAGMKIHEIFAEHGEAYFRAGEARVIARLL